jgi:hypothetical protein
MATVALSALLFKKGEAPHFPEKFFLNAGYLFSEISLRVWGTRRP